MENGETSYNERVIRALLLEAFSAAELNRFLLGHDRLKPITDSFGPGHGKDDMVDETIDYCRQHALLDLLLAEVEKARPEQYLRFKPYLRISPEALAAVPSPYRGLEPFEVEHAENYFGRQPMVKRLIAAVRQQPFVTVVGPSGCGKSSLVRAGLLTAVRYGALPDSRAWATSLFRPGTDPLYALCRQWVALLQPEATGVTQQVEAARQAAALAEGSLATAHVVADLRNTRPAITRVLLVVDQFEELYTECRDRERQRSFVQALLAAAGEPDVGVVVTLRADFYGRALADRRLGQAVDAGLINVLPMSDRELRETIEKPARRAGRLFEAGLVDRILADVAGEPGNLPLLEFALLKLWEKQTAGGLLTHGAYEENGCVRGAIAQHAEEVYAELEREHRAETAQRILLRLTHYGDGAGETRRQALLTDLITPRTPRDKVQPVVETLARHRLVVTGREDAPAGEKDGAAQAVTVEVAHEALIQGWDRLRHWLAEDRVFGLWREGLAAARRVWDGAGQDEGALLRGATLSEAEGWLARRGQDLNRAERGFVEKSLALRAREEEQRQAQQRRDAQLAAEQRSAGRLRRLSTGLLVAVLAAIVLAGTALVLWNNALGAGRRAEAEAQARATAQVEAEIGRDQAERARQEADALKLAFASQSQLTQNQELALLLAIEARRAGPSLETDSALWAWLNNPGRTLHILEGHEQRVTRAVWSPDGQWIATASDDGTARVWEAATGRQLAALAGHPGGVFDVAWSPKGDQILTAGCDELGQEPGTCARSSARVWQAASWQETAILTGHSRWVWDAAWSPDGRTIATAGQDGSTRLYDAGSGAELAVLEGHAAGVRAVAWSPDGRRLVTASFDNTGRVWDVSALAAAGDAGVTEGASLVGHSGRLLSVAWSPDGERIVTSSLDGTARVWDAANGNELAILRHGDTVWHAAWDGQGRRVVTASSDGTARIWVVPTPGGKGQEAEAAQVMEHGGAVQYAAWDGTDRRVVTAAVDKMARVWDADSGVELAILAGHQQAVEYAAWDDGGRRIATASADRTARVWVVGRGTEAAVLRGHKAAVLDAAWDPDGQKVLTTSGDQTARVWAPWDGDEPTTLATLKPGVAQATWSADGRRILTGGQDGQARVWDVSTGTELAALGAAPIPLVAAAWVDAEQRIVGLGMDGTLTAWDGATRSEVAMLPAPPGAPPQAAMWSADRRHLAIVGLDGIVQLADLSSVLNPTETALAGQVVPAGHAAWSPDGRRLAIAGMDSVVRVWDLASGAAGPRLYAGHTLPVAHVAWDPAGRRLASSSADGTARVWDAQSGASLVVLQGHTDAVTQAAWSPDGTRIATGSDDRTARLWDVATGRNLAILSGHAGPVSHVAWDPLGDYVVTAGADGTARIFYAHFADMAAWACERSVRNLSSDEWIRYMGREPTRETCPGKPVPEPQP